MVWLLTRVVRIALSRATSETAKSTMWDSCRWLYRGMPQRFCGTSLSSTFWPPRHVPEKPAHLLLPPPPRIEPLPLL